MEPITRKEVFLNAMCADKPCALEPVSREEILLKRLVEAEANEGGGSGLPSGAKPNQYIVTDGDGNAKWEDRMVYQYKTVAELCPEQQLELIEEMDGLYHYWFSLNPAEVFEGALCNVTLDGKEYECIVHFFEDEYGGYWMAGNMGLAGMGEDTGEPFAVASYGDICLKNSGDHTLKVSAEVVEYKKLPSEAMENGSFVKVHESIYMTEEEASAYAGMIGGEYGRYMFLAWGNNMFTYVGRETQGGRAKLSLSDYLGRRYIVFRSDEGTYSFRDATCERFYLNVPGSESDTYSLRMRNEGPVIVSPNKEHSDGPTNIPAFRVESNSAYNDFNFEVLGNGEIKTRAMTVLSSTRGSKKTFKITVDDAGTISATEVVTDN